MKLETSMFRWVKCELGLLNMSLVCQSFVLVHQSFVGGTWLD